MGLDTPNSELLQRFNRGFPHGYTQFASSTVQHRNLQLAYRLHRSKEAVIQLSEADDLTFLDIAARNQSFLLSDVFGVLAAHPLTVRGLSLYGQIHSPMLAFARVLLSQGDRPLARETTASLEYALRGALSEQFPVRGMLRSDTTSLGPVETVTTAFRIDPIAHLPSLSIQTALPPSANPIAFYYKIAHALWQEDLLAVNADLQVWKADVRLVLHLLGPNATQLPDYLGHKVADSIQQRLAS